MRLEGWRKLIALVAVLAVAAFRPDVFTGESGKYVAGLVAMFYGVNGIEWWSKKGVGNV